MVWHFCLKTYADKLEKPNELALRSVFQDKENDYRFLLNKTDKTTLYNHRIQNFALLMYKALNNIAPSQTISLEDLIFYLYPE